MKKLFLTLLILAFAGSSWACTAGDPVRATLHGAGTSIIQVPVTCTADGAGAFTAASVTSVGGCLLAVHWDEGSTTTDGTVTIAVTMGDVDLLGGNGADVDVSGGYASITPQNKDGNEYLACFSGDLSVAPTANTAASANPNIYLVFAP